MAESYPSAPQNAPDAKQHQGRKGGRGRIALIGGIVLLLLLFAYGIIPRMRQNRALADESKKEGSKLPQVVVIKPRPSPDADLTLPGTTEAIADTVIAARTTGYIRKRYVDIGSHVTTGQVLADIDAPDVEASLQQARQQTQQAISGVRQAESDVTNRQATVAQAQGTVQQAEANVEQSRAQLADAQAKLAQARAQLSQSQSQLAQQEHNVDVQRAALKQAQAQLDLATVTLRRYETLLKSGFVALQDVDQSRATYETERAAVNSAEAALSGAEANVKAFQDQVQSSRANVTAFAAQVTAAQKNVKAVSATVNTARAAVNAANANVRSAQAVVQADQSNVQAAKANEQRFGVQSQFSRITAPFDGVITARNVDVGSLINAGSGAGGSTASGGGGQSSQTISGSASTASATPTTSPGGGLFGLARTDVLRVYVSVPQTYAQLMRPGIRAELLLREHPGQLFEGTITNVSGAIDAVSRTLLTEVHIPNQTGALLPGMYTQVHFDLPKTRGSLRIPSSALAYDAQGTRVAIVTQEHKIHYVPVRVGRDFGAEIEITDGLTGQEDVVSNPTDDLVEGLKVDPKQPPPPPPGQPGAPPGQPAQHGGQAGAPPAQGRRMGAPPAPGGPAAPGGQPPAPPTPANGQPAPADASGAKPARGQLPPPPRNPGERAQQAAPSTPAESSPNTTGPNGAPEPGGNNIPPK